MWKFVRRSNGKCGGFLGGLMESVEVFRRSDGRCGGLLGGLMGSVEVC